MNLLDSGNVQNQIKVRSMVCATIVHATLAMITNGISIFLLLLTGLITYSLLKDEINDASSDSNKFKNDFPFRYYGEIFGSFHHVFSHEEILESNIYSAIDSELKSKTPIDTLSTITITDIDKDLSSSESRTFIKAESGQTSRGTTITLILYQSCFGKMQSISWRVLAGGYIDKDKEFNLIAYSLFSLVFWIIPYITREHDILSRIRTINSGAYNIMDVITNIRCIHLAVFDAMINELEKNNIDTSDLKAQKAQVMNINVSGGRLVMGNAVQGAMNKVSNLSKENK